MLLMRSRCYCKNEDGLSCPCKSCVKVLSFPFGGPVHADRLRTGAEPNRECEELVHVMSDAGNTRPHLCVGVDVLKVKVVQYPQALVAQ